MSVSPVTFSIAGLVLLFTLLFSPIPVNADEPRVFTRQMSGGSLDPRKSSTNTAYQLLSDLYEGLVRVNADGEQEPGAAESWQIDPATKTITFKLKQGLKWSDGEPLTAHDFKYAWSSVIRSGENSNFRINPFYKILSRIKGAKAYAQAPENGDAGLGIRIPDAHTLIVEFDRFDAIFPLRSHNPGLFPVPRHFVEKHGKNWWKRGDTPTNGAYRYASIDLKENILADSGKVYQEGVIELAPNPEHRDVNRLHLDKVRYLLLSAAEITESQYFFGQRVHIYPALGVASDDQGVSDIVSAAGYEIKHLSKLSTFMVFLDVERINNPRLVEAIKYLIDPLVIISRSPYRFHVPAYRMFNRKGYPFEVANSYKIDSEARVQKAQALLAELGVSREQPVNLNMYSRLSNYEETLIAYLGEFGININLLDVDHASFRSQSGKAGKIDLMNFRWYVSVPDPSGFMLSVSWSGVEVLPPAEKVKFEQLLDEASLLVGDARLHKYQEAESLLVNKAGVIPLAHVAGARLVHKDICGWQTSDTIIFPSMWMRWCDG